MDRKQIQKIADNIDFSWFSYFDPEKIDQQITENTEFTELNDITYYKEIKTENNRRYILCFNPQLFRDQRQTRDASIANYREFVEKVNEELLLAKNSRIKDTIEDKL
jgi:hypothetical protein